MIYEKVFIVFVVFCCLIQAVTAKGNKEKEVILPEWAKNPPEETADIVYFVGKGDRGSTIKLKRETAKMEALRSIALWINAKIEVILREYSGETGETGDSQSPKIYQQEIITIYTNVNISGAKEEASWIAPDESYVLVLYSYNKKSLIDILKEEIQNKDANTFKDVNIDAIFERLDKNLNP